jgi:predicted small metal-binding protein
MTRALTCGCGYAINAPDDEELFHAVRRHLVMVHLGEFSLGEQQIRALIAAQARTVEEAAVG